MIRSLSMSPMSSEDGCLPVRDGGEAEQQTPGVAVGADGFVAGVALLHEAGR